MPFDLGGLVPAELRPQERRLQLRVAAGAGSIEVDLWTDPLPILPFDDEIVALRADISELAVMVEGGVEPLCRAVYDLVAARRGTLRLSVAVETGEGARLQLCSSGNLLRTP